mgnify:CR=1 FL=1
MTGFIKGLFGKKKNDEASTSDNSAAQQRGAYYLEPDDAKTFGDIDYMRTSKTVKRTFAKGDARVRQVSAMKEADMRKTPPSSVESWQPKTQPKSESPKSESKTSSFNSTSNETKRRSPDSSMDMFRNMAKDIRK